MGRPPIITPIIIISDPIISKTARTIFLKLCTILDIDQRKKMTWPDHPKKNWIIQKVQKCGQNDSFLTFSENDSNDFDETNQF